MRKTPFLFSIGILGNRVSSQYGIFDKSLPKYPIVQFSSVLRHTPLKSTKDGPICMHGLFTACIFGYLMVLCATNRVEFGCLVVHFGEFHGTFCRYRS